MRTDATLMPAEAMRANPNVPAAPRCWIGVVPQNEALAAVAGGYVEINRGRAGPLERMRAGDAFALYSPRTSADGTALQAFTALGRVADGVVYQAPRPADRRPFRLTAAYYATIPAPIRPLLPSLAFIRNPAHWGAAFRFGFLRVPDADFVRIVAAMVPAAQPAPTT
jgi:hypothetical protein